MANAPQEFDLAPGQTPHQVRQTAAAAITIPASVPMLAHLQIKGHATEPTVLGILYDGVNRAMFFCEADGWAEFDLSHKVGTALAATWLTVVSDDTPQEWTLTFDKVGYGPGLDTYRGIFFESEVADSTTPVTVTYTGGESVPVAAIGGQTTGVAAAAARWAFPQIGDIQTIVEVGDNPASKMTYKQPAPLPKSTTLTLVPTLAGAATYTVLVVYFVPA